MYLKFLTDLRLVALLVLQRLLELFTYLFGFDLPVGMQTIAIIIILMAFVAKSGNKMLLKKRCRLLNFQHFVDLLHLFTSSWHNDLMLAALWGVSVVWSLTLWLEQVEIPVVQTSLLRRFQALVFIGYPQSLLADILTAIIIAAIPVSLENGLYSGLAIFVTGKMVFCHHSDQI